MENYQICQLAKIYGLVAEMEALKAEIQMMKTHNEQYAFTYSSAFFSEKADQIRGIANELQQLGIYHG